MKKGLSRSRSEVWGKLGGIFTSGKIDDDALEEIEEILYGADIGPATAQELIDALQEEVKKEGFGEDQFKAFLKNFLKEKMKSVQENIDSSLFEYKKAEPGLPKVIMIVGVNGAGKTTTIGKLATKLTNQGANVVVGACDTFRAAAVDQLQVWCDRAGAKMIRAKEGANPSGVGYDALSEAMSSNADYCILDTAGRLHTAENLMVELAKSKNVLKKLMPDAPHQVLLVIDAITGQNAIRQAEEFNKALDLTGLIFTKCDGSSKAGSAVAIVQKLQVPITYIGVGENVEDLNEFALNDYIDALVGN
ncbi:MAG: signal recognition particle-docking protein FtsY [Bacteriovorax sp. MedPE-SWde]|nr:MAG: signal recognition particle-docking protein FtsY [Bacteriovorax sp. MedPE-SWde]